MIEYIYIEREGGGEREREIGRPQNPKVPSAENSKRSKYILIYTFKHGVYTIH